MNSEQWSCELKTINKPRLQAHLPCIHKHAHSTINTSSFPTIFDRDPRFTSQFGKDLMMKLGINQNISTVFHPQTDGLSERKNQWVEQYLQIVKSANPEDWTQWLALASAVHNNWRNTTTGLSPNQILLGYELPLTPETSPPSNNDLVEQCIRKLMENRD